MSGVNRGTCIRSGGSRQTFSNDCQPSKTTPSVLGSQLASAFPERLLSGRLYTVSPAATGVWSASWFISDFYARTSAFAAADCAPSIGWEELVGGFAFWPMRLTGRYRSHQRELAVNKRALGCAAVTLVSGLALFRWGSGPLRSSGGDVLIVILITALFATVRWWTPPVRIAVVIGLGVVAECVQLLGLVDRDSHWVWHLTLGSTFDPWDIVFYVLGGVVALGAEWVWDDKRDRHGTA